MKIMDRLGNELKVGDVLYFAPLQGLVTILKIEEPGKLSSAPGRICFELQTPFTLDEGKRDAVFADVMKVHHPNEGSEAERKVAEILSGASQYGDGGGVPGKPVRVLDRGRGKAG